MPIYEYECPRRGVLFERIQKIDDQLVVECPNKPCQGYPKKLISNGAVHVFDAQFCENIDHEPVYVRTKQDVVDAVNRHNDTELAQKQGRLHAHL